MTGPPPDSLQNRAKKVGMHAIQIVPPGTRRSAEADSCVDSLDSVIESIARL